MKNNFQFIKSIICCATSFTFCCFIYSSIYAQYIEMIEIASSEARWTGVAVSGQQRIFVNYPRWSNITCAVAEINGKQILPFPDSSWNNWHKDSNNMQQFVCVQSVYVDAEDNLWVLDAGANLTTGVIKNAPKLVKITLATNSVCKVFYFDSSVVSRRCYLNDVKIDDKGNYAYISESGEGSIIVLNLLTGKTRRILQQHFSTKAEAIELNINNRNVKFPVHADGIALSNRDNSLYYKALSGHNLYRIAIKYLIDFNNSDAEIEKQVERVAQTMPCDAIEFDRSGNLYITAIEKNAIYKYNSNGKLELVISSEKLTWPDSFAIDAIGNIYVTTSGILFPKTPHYLFLLKK